jgi:hypothetical protein
MADEASAEEVVLIGDVPLRIKRRGVEMRARFTSFI